MELPKLLNFEEHKSSIFSFTEICEFNRSQIISFPVYNLSLFCCKENPPPSSNGETNVEITINSWGLWGTAGKNEK